MPEQISVDLHLRPSDVSGPERTVIIPSACRWSHVKATLASTQRADHRFVGQSSMTWPQRGPREQSSIPVDQDLLCGLLGSGGVVGPFDEFAVLELRAGADERHEMGRVDHRQRDWAASISL